MDLNENEQGNAPVAIGNQEPGDSGMVEYKDEAARNAEEKAVDDGNEINNDNIMEVLNELNKNESGFHTTFGADEPKKEEGKSLVTGRDHTAAGSEGLKD